MLGISSDVARGDDLYVVLDWHEVDDRNTDRCDAVHVDAVLPAIDGYLHPAGSVSIKFTLARWNSVVLSVDCDFVSHHRFASSRLSRLDLSAQGIGKLSIEVLVVTPDDDTLLRICLANHVNPIIATVDVTVT